MELKSIDTLHRTKTGKISDKWASYLPYYDSLFGPLRHQPISMLEIGVQNGGSLETWSEFFKEAQLFVGCDIDPKCEGLRYDDPRVKVIVGDANAAPTFQKILATNPSYDIVIDDGSHVSTDILNSFINYFPHVKPGGVYVVEDAHCLYMNQYGGGILNEYSAYAFFKRLIDVTSFQFWQEDLSIAQYFRTFFDLRATPSFIAEGWVESIEFRNSIITIKKATRPGHDKLGDRITVGSVAQVQDWGGKKLPG
ncbi:MAG: class I SAM-dependent methyltransferase [Rubrivivax sp.]|nr:MAG: class I SAM-dependent methyltransferase [Rubrivivax sp.]